MQKHLKNDSKSDDSSLSRMLASLSSTLHSLEIPMIRPIHSAFYRMHQYITSFFSNLLRILYWTPLFKSQILNSPEQLYLYSGIPQLLGAPDLIIGNHCRISGQTIICARESGNQTPRLVIGDNVSISWQNEILIGNNIQLGNNVRFGVKVRLIGFAGHPVDPIARAKGLPDSDNQVGEITIGNDVWLAAGVTVAAGVTIGSGTIVTTGSVVTQDLPSGVLAGGIPATVIEKLKMNNKPGQNHG